MSKAQKLLLGSQLVTPWRYQRRDVPVDSDATETYEEFRDGLTKRELIAAMVLQGMVSAGLPWPQMGRDETLMARTSVRCADALLAELASNPADSGAET